MKKLLIFILLPLLFASCTDNENDGTNITMINLAAKASDWKRQIQAEPYYYVTYTMPEINSWVYNNGVINVFQTFSGATQPLPVVRHNQDSQGAQWTRTIDFDYGVRTLTIYVTDSDFEEDPPGEMTFKVAIIW